MKTFAAMLNLIGHVTVADKFADDDESSERWQKSRHFCARNGPPTSDQLRRWFVDITFLSACTSKSTTIVNGFIDKFSSFLCCFPKTLVKHSPDCLPTTFLRAHDRGEHHVAVCTLAHITKDEEKSDGLYNFPTHTHPADEISEWNARVGHGSDAAVVYVGKAFSSSPK